MTDYISRQEAIGYCYALINAENPNNPSDEWNYSQERINQTEVILHHLEFMQSAQPEIIRCKDCKHYYFADNRVPSEQSWVCDAWGADQTAHMGYCFKAERKDNG